MAEIKSGASSDQLTIDPVSKAARVTKYDAAGRELSTQSKALFYASGTFTPAATPTDLVTIFGSASKKVRVLSFKITTTNTAAGSQQFFLIKRAAVNSGGTAVSATLVPAETGDVATATVQHYTANPAALGTSAGTINTKRVASPVATPATWAGITREGDYEMLNRTFSDPLQKPLTLTANTEGLCLNFNGVALVAGQTHAYQVIWTEE